MSMITSIEEFAFPVLVSSTGAFIGSPPLWRHVDPTQASSTSSASSSSEEEEEEQQQQQQQQHQQREQLNSSYIRSTEDHRRLNETATHETMDSLWESFNEEMSRNRHPFECDSATHSLTKANDGGKAVLRKNKKLKGMVLAKVLKRLFLLQHQSVKKRSW